MPKRLWYLTWREGREVAFCWFDNLRFARLVFALLHAQGRWPMITREDL